MVAGEIDRHEEKQFNSSPSPAAVTPVLAARDGLGNARCVQQPSPPARASSALRPDPALHGSDSLRRMRWLTPGFRKFLRDQQLFVFVGVLVCLALWALHIPTSYLSVIVMSVCIECSEHDDELCQPLV